MCAANTGPNLRRGAVGDRAQVLGSIAQARSALTERPARLLVMAGRSDVAAARVLLRDHPHQKVYLEDMLLSGLLSQNLALDDAATQLVWAS